MMAPAGKLYLLFSLVAVTNKPLELGDSAYSQQLYIKQCSDINNCKQNGSAHL
jgi:hypothetical protein